MLLRRPVHLLVTAGAVVCALEIALAQCISPTGKSGNGWRPDTVVRYQFIGSWDHQSCVVNALNKWTTANQGKSNVSFQPVESGQSANLTLNKVNLPVGIGGGITTPSRDADGYITGVGVQFTDDTTDLDSCTGFLKVALHELGHTQNLNDTSGSGGSSVMNQMSGKNDIGGNIPTDVTSCDSNAANNEAPTDNDVDNDGYLVGEDCNDEADWINPGVGDPPPCGHTGDWNCNGTADETECVSPVCVDVRGNGFALTDHAAGVQFDFDGNGSPERISWTAVGSDDAWLVLDRNNNGRIDNGAELFGNWTPQPLSTQPKNGFLALAVFDGPTFGGNANGWFDPGDRYFDQVRLWRDSNHDGVSQPDELLRLRSVNIGGISLEYLESRHEDRWGNWFRYRARVFDTTPGGIGRFAYDVFLLAAPAAGSPNGAEKK
jgi:hypothetical protein